MAEASKSKGDGGKYKVLNGISYPQGDAAPGDIVDNLNAAQAKHYLANGDIEEVN